MGSENSSVLDPELDFSDFDPELDFILEATKHQ
jgi:hypothetical protein